MHDSIAVWVAIRYVHMTFNHVHRFYIIYNTIISTKPFSIIIKKSRLKVVHCTIPISLACIYSLGVIIEFQ